MFQRIKQLVLQIILVCAFSSLAAYGQASCSVSANCSTCLSGGPRKVCACPLLEQQGMTTTACCCNTIPGGDCTAGGCGGCCQRFRIDSAGDPPAFGQICRSLYCVSPAPACVNTFNCLGAARASNPPSDILANALQSNPPNVSVERMPPGQITPSLNPIPTMLFNDAEVPIQLTDAEVKITGNRFESFQIRTSSTIKEPVSAMILVLRVVLKDKNIDVMGFNIDSLIGGADLNDLFRLMPEFKVGQEYTQDISRVEIALTFAEARSGKAFGINSAEVAKSLAIRRQPELDRLLQAKRFVEQLEPSPTDREQFQDLLTSLASKGDCLQVIDLLTSTFQASGLSGIRKLVSSYSGILGR